MKLAAASLLLFVVGAWTLSAEETPSQAAPPFRISDGVTRPEKISGEAPRYAEAARKARVQGVVIVEAIIDETGSVTNARVVKGLPMGLNQSALEAVKTWKFKPSTLEGRPVKVYYTLTVSFKIEGDASYSYGPLFRKFLAENDGFAKLLAAARFQEADQLLARLATERPQDPEISFARCYLLLEEDRLGNAWQAIQSYRGPDPFELYTIFGFYAWRKVYTDKILSLGTRAEIIAMGIEAETKAMKAREDALPPVVYQGYLLLAKAALTSDPKEQKALGAELMRLRDLGKELFAKGKTTAPYPMNPIWPAPQPASTRP